MKPGSEFTQSKKFHILCIGFSLIIGLNSGWSGTTYIESSPADRSQIVLWAPEPGDSALTCIQFTTGRAQTIWSYHFQPSGPTRFSDVKLADVTGDFRPDIIAVAQSVIGDGENTDPWLMIFPATPSGFSNAPLTVAEAVDGRKPERVTVGDVFRDGNDSWLVLAQGTPRRQALVCQLKQSPNGFSIAQAKTLAAPLVSTGYGRVFAQAIPVGGKTFIILFSTESNLLKTAVFSFPEGKLVAEEVLVLNGTRSLIGPGILHLEDTDDGFGRLLLPFKNGEVLTLATDGKTTKLEPAGQEYIFQWTGSRRNLTSMLAERLFPTLAEALPATAAVLAAPTPDYRDTLKLGETLRVSLPVDSGMTFYSFSWSSPPAADSRFVPESMEIVWTPQRHNLGTTDFNFVRELKTGETVATFRDSVGQRHQVKPVLIRKRELLTVTVLDTIIIDTSRSDSILTQVPEPQVFSIIVATPAGLKNDRFRFEGEAPVGLLVHESNRIPGTQKKLVDHIITTDLNRITENKQVKFRYFTPDSTAQPGTTLTVIHDLESNVVYMSVDPPLDTIPQSFDPDAWTLDFSGYPEYFFEGFPRTMTMDSARQALVFKFSNTPETNILNSSIMMISPRATPHWLSLYLDENALVEIQGEVKVKENLSKKLITRIRLRGAFDPRLLRTRLTPREKVPGNLQDQILPLHEIKDETELETVQPVSAISPDSIRETADAPETAVDSLQSDRNPDAEPSHADSTDTGG